MRLQVFRYARILVKDSRCFMLKYPAETWDNPRVRVLQEKIKGKGVSIEKG